MLTTVIPSHLFLSDMSLKNTSGDSAAKHTRLTADPRCYSPIWGLTLTSLLVVMSLAGQIVRTLRNWLPKFFSTGKLLFQALR